MDDVATLEEFTQSGSGDVFAQLVGRHVHFVYSACFRRLRDAVAADTATQAVFVLLVRHAKGLRGVKSLVPWLFNTAYHVCGKVKRSMPRVERPEAYLAPTDWPLIADEFDEALAGLASDARDAFLLKYTANLSLREVADALGVSDTAAGQRISRATAALRSFYEGENLFFPADALVARVQTYAVRPAPASASYNATLAALSPGPTPASQIADQVMTSIRRTRVLSVVTFACLLALVALAVPKLYSMAKNMRIAASQPATQTTPIQPATRERPQMEITAEPGPQVKPVRPVDPELASRMIDAIRAGDVRTVERLIEHDDAVVNAKDTAGKPAVALAAEMALRQPRESTKIAELLIDNGAPTDVFIAARAGHVNQVARHLIAERWLMNATDRDGLTPLQHAALLFGTSPECEQVVDLLINKAGATIDLWTACTFAMPAEVESALNASPQSVNQPALGGTPLAWAARPRRYGGEDLAIANLLIARSADLRSRDDMNEGMTPLHHAAAWGDQTALAGLLIEKGVDVNIGDDYMLTPLDHALAKNRREMAAFLESKGGKRTTVDHVNPSTKTGRFIATVKSGDKAQVKVLLDDTPELAKSRGMTGETPLHHAAAIGSVDIVDLLLADKADVNAHETNKFGGTPLHWAVRHGQVGMVKHLLAKRADAKAVNQRTGQTLLHAAAKHGASGEIKQLLAGLGIDPAVKDRFGKTAEDYSRGK